MFGEGFILDLPRFFTLFGFNIYYYGLFITAGYALAALYLIKRRKLFGLTRDNILDVLIIAIPCGLIGARIYYMIFKYDQFFGPGQWENILKIREGGLAVYGGIIASGLVFILYSRYKKIPLGNMLDAAGFGLFIGQAIGRWGNFINREAYGEETSLPWRMGLTTGDGTRYFHPAFLYESLWNAAGLVIIHVFSKKSKTKYPGQYFLFYVAWYGLGRFMIEGLRTDSLRIPGTEMRASQWLAAISFLVAIGILIYNQYFRKDGLSVYGEDAEDDEEAESAEELAILDGASEDDVSLEAKDDEDEDEAVAEVDEDDEADAHDDDEVDDADAEDADAEDDEADAEVDDADADDDNDEAELAILDGASGDEVENEPDDAPEPDDDNDEAELAVLDEADAEDDEADAEADLKDDEADAEDDAEADDDNDEAELGMLDGASGDEVENEPDDGDSGPENKTETNPIEKKKKIKIRRKK